MARYTKDMGGATILSDLRAQFTAAQQSIHRSRDNAEWPPEYRRKVRSDAIAEVNRLVAEASHAFNEWAVAEVADARRRYASDPVASQAQETRRLTNEMRLSRLIAQGRAADERDGSRVIGGTVVANASAHDYAAQAMTAYMDGRYDEAQVFATASIALGGPREAQRAYDLAQDQLDLDSPTRKQALADIAEAERAARVFVRDVNAARASLLHDAADAAKAVGDDERGYLRDAVGPSMASKAAALAIATATGTEYVHPEGAMTDRPMGGTIPLSDAQAARLTDTGRGVELR